MSCRVLRAEVNGKDVISPSLFFFFPFLGVYHS